jgi:hypothetical protein
MMLRFLRKLCQRSENTTAALMSIPRPVSQVWSDSGFDKNFADLAGSRNQYWFSRKIKTPGCLPTVRAVHL